MMTNDVHRLIRSASSAARRRDFLLLLGAVAAVFVALAVLSDLGWRAAVFGFAACAAAFFLRYKTATSRVWFRPVERLVDQELAGRRKDQTALGHLDAVLDELPDPVVLLDGAGRVDYANLAAREVFAQAPERRHISALMRAPEVLAAIEDAVPGAPAQSIDFDPPGAVERMWRAAVRPIGGGDESGVLLLMRDMTSERRLERMRVDFVANASHELRTPLSSLLGFIETLRGHAKDDAAARDRFLGIMQGQAERMGRLIDDLLSLSRIELNEHVPPNDVVDLAAAVRDVADGLGPLAAANGMRIEVHNGAGGAARVIGQRDEIIQVIQNLVDNAIKYGTRDTAIEVRLGLGAPPTLDPVATPDTVHHAGDYLNQVAARAGAELEDYVHVQVRDRGAGVARSDLPRLTERFYRVDAETSRARGGTGLGLAIVKHIVNRHRGALEVESALGTGSAFTASFRRAGEPAAAEAAQ